MDNLPIDISIEQLIFLLIVLGAGFINWVKSKMENRQPMEEDSRPDLDWEEAPHTEHHTQRPSTQPEHEAPDLPPFLRRAFEAMGVPEESLKPRGRIEEEEASSTPPPIPTVSQKAAEVVSTVKSKAKWERGPDAWLNTDKLAERAKGLTQAERKALRDIVDQKADEKIYKIREKPVHKALPVRTLLKPDNIRAAFVLQEILGQPKGMPPEPGTKLDR